MHPDPSICRVGRDFYLACSSFEYFPGVPIFHSRDLVHWREIGHALTRRSQLDLAGVPSSGGVYAPTLRHHEGTYYLVTTLVGRGNFVVTARRPAGPWSDPAWLDEDGFDPSLAFLDGRVYYTRAGPGSDADHPWIYQTELDLSGDTPRLVRRPRVIWKGTGGIWPEAPHLFRRGPWHYLLTAEGGTSYGHSVVVARSRRPYGPFEASPHGPLLTHRDRPRDPIQATGHADLVELEDGSTWAVLLGIRPTGRHTHLGRESFLAPVGWGEDGWPRLTRLRLRMDAPPLPAALVPPPAAREEFDATSLPAGWMFVRNPSPQDWSLRERPGHLRLWGSACGLGDACSPALVCRRQEHFEMTVRARLEFDPGGPDERAGLCLRASEGFHAALLVGRAAGAREAVLAVTRSGRTRTAGRARVAAGALTLWIEATRRSYTFGIGSGGRARELGRVPASLFAAETILAATGRHHFTGTTVGLVALGGDRRSTAPADFDWFEYVAA